MIYRWLHLAGFVLSIVALNAIAQWASASRNHEAHALLRTIRNIPQAQRTRPDTFIDPLVLSPLITFPQSIHYWPHGNGGYEMKTIRDFEEAVSWLWGEEGMRKDYGLQPDIRAYTSSFIFQDVITFMIARDHEVWVYYRPKLAIVLMDYGHDELAIDIDTFRVPATRILSMTNPQIQPLVQELRQKGAFFLVHHDYTEIESGMNETMIIERAAFPYRILDDFDLPVHDFADDEREVITWKLKGLLYRCLEESFDQGFALMVIGSSAKELDGLYRVLDEWGEIPVHFTHFLLWEKAYW